jgi:hypothetical protein
MDSIEHRLTLVLDAVKDKRHDGTYYGASNIQKRRKETST